MYLKVMPLKKIVHFIFPSVFCQNGHRFIFLVFLVHFFYFRNQSSDLQFSTYERTLRRIKNSSMPPSPKDIEGIEEAFANEEVNRLYGQTMHTDNVDKNQFYRTTYRCDDFGYSVFASQRTIDLIHDNYTVAQRKYLMDATFYVVPLLFMQLLIIYFQTPSKQVIH